MRSAELAITSLICNERKSLEVRNTSEKCEKIRAKSKKLDEDAMLCNTLWSERRNKVFFLPYSERNFAFAAKKKFSSATLSAINCHVRSNYGI